MPRDSPPRPTSPSCSGRCHLMTSTGSCAETPKRCLAPRDAVGLTVDLRYPEHAEAFRCEVRAFLAEHADAASDLDVDVDAWRRVLWQRGYLALTWPLEYGGGGRSLIEQVVLAEEFARAGVPTGA